MFIVLCIILFAALLFLGYRYRNLKQERANLEETEAEVQSVRQWLDCLYNQKQQANNQLLEV